MTSALIYSITSIIISLNSIPTKNDAANSSIATMPIPDDMAPVGDIDKIVYSFLGRENVILNEYIQMMSDIFSVDIFNKNLQFLSQIRMKCLPRIYSRLKKIKLNDFGHCHQLHKNLINALGNRILEACKKSDSFMKCLNNAKKSLTDEYDNIEEDIVGLFLDEMVGGTNSCMGDITRQLKTFSELVQKEC